MYIRGLVYLFMCVWLASCANTSLLGSWKDEVVNQPYQHPLIIGVSDSQQTRRLYEKIFVAKLKDNNIGATPSYTLISSKKKINRENVVNAIKDTNIDAVLVTYLIAAESEMKYRESPLNIGYSGSSEDNRISETIISSRGQSRSEEIFVLKNDLYDVNRKMLVWSAKTKTVGPESIDEVILDVTELLIKTMLNDGVLK